MTGSDTTSVISIAGDPERREALGRALREAGFSVVIAASPEEAMGSEGASRSGSGYGDRTPPQVRIVSRPGSASGTALQADDIEILLPEHARATVLADAALALVRWCAALPARDTGVSAERSLAAVCHDLRTPLSVMVGWLHLMQSGKLDQAGMTRAIEKLHDSLREQVSILDRMLEVADARRDGAPAGPPARP